MIIRIENISKSYGEIKALDSFSMEINAGEMLGLVGPNGAGKSTLIKIMLGIIKPTSGRVTLNGEALTDKNWKELRKGIGYMPERVSFYDNLTGYETLQLFAKVKQGSIDNISDILKRILTEEALQRRVGGYSKGMRQRLNLAQSLLNEPNFLVLDEPTSGLDPVGTREFYEILSQVRKIKKVTVILSSHILAEIEDKIDRVAIIKNGNLKAIGSLEELYTGLELSLMLCVTVKNRNELLEELLKKEGAADIAYRNNLLTASIPKENKLRILSEIIKEKDSFDDLSVREPSLEEVFFGVH